VTRSTYVPYRQNSTLNVPVWSSLTLAQKLQIQGLP